MNTGRSVAQDYASMAASFAARAQAAERDRRIPDDSIADLRNAGVFRAFTPSRYGGGEQSSLLDVFAALIQVGQGCSSTAWVASLLACHNCLLASFSGRVQDEIWAQGPDTLTASSVAPSGQAKRVAAGFALRGKWAFASGVDHCNWTIVTSMVADEPAATGAHLFLVPAEDYDIIDDWHVSGLRGTGSKSISIPNEIFVPQHRVERVVDITERTLRGGNVSWQRNLPWQILFNYAFAPAAIGTAMSAIAAFTDQVAMRRAAYTGVAFRERPNTLSRLAESTAEVDGARLVLERDIDELERCAKTCRSLPSLTIERMLFDVSYIVDSCSHAVLRLFRASGGHALYESNPLQRLFRDMHAITQHPAVDFDFARERYGKCLLVAGNHSAT